MVKLKVRKVGNSMGTIFPVEFVKKMNLEEGDYLFLLDTPEGYKVTPYDPDFEQAMDEYRKGKKTYRNALRELAK
jgi:putative addiction module antidote